MLQFSTLHLHLEDGERYSQSYFNEYGWLGSDLTQNIQGRLCPNIPGGFINLKTLR